MRFAAFAFQGFLAVSAGAQDPIFRPSMRLGDVWMYRVHEVRQSSGSGITWADYTTHAEGFRIENLEGMAGNRRIAARFAKTSCLETLMRTSRDGMSTKDSAWTTSSHVSCEESLLPNIVPKRSNSNWREGNISTIGKCTDFSSFAIGLQWWKDTLMALPIAPDPLWGRPLGDSLDTLLNLSGEFDGRKFYFTYFYHPSHDGISKWSEQVLWVDSLGILDWRIREQTGGRNPYYEVRRYLEFHNGEDVGLLGEEILASIPGSHQTFLKHPLRDSPSDSFPDCAVPKDLFTSVKKPPISPAGYGMAGPQEKPGFSADGRRAVPARGRTWMPIFGQVE